MLDILLFPPQEPEELEPEELEPEELESEVLSLASLQEPEVLSLASLQEPDVLSLVSLQEPDVLSLASLQEPDVLSLASLQEPEVLSLVSLQEPDVLSLASLQEPEELEPDVLSLASLQEPDVLSLASLQEPEELEPDVLSLASLQEPEVQVSRGPEKLRLVLVGKTGAGKSSTGNTLLGGGAFFHTSCRPHTDTHRWKVRAGSMEGRPLTLVDTPGLGSPDGAGQTLKEEVISGLEGVAPGPHAFLLVLRVGRFTQEEKAAVERLQRWFGNRMFSHTVILFTHGDDLDRGMDIWEHINANSDLRELVELCRKRVHVVDNMHWNERSTTDDDELKVELLLRLMDLKGAVSVGRAQMESLLHAVVRSEITTGPVRDHHRSGPRSPQVRSEITTGSPVHLGETCDSAGEDCDGARSRNNRAQISGLIRTLDEMVEESGYYTRGEPCCIL